MFTPRSPIYLSHAPAIGVTHFATLAAVEAGYRAILISVMPLLMYEAISDERMMSVAYLVVGILSLVTGLLVPWVTRHLPRRWTFTAAGGLYLAGVGAALSGSVWGVPLALLLNAMGTVTYTICLSAYVLDHIEREDLGRNESTRMLFSAPSWALGPVIGVALRNWWAPAPFLVAAVFAVAMVALFWRYRLGDGRQIQRARGPAPNPLAYLGRFFQQPRLIAGWLFASIRSCGWWVYVVYLPVFCIQAGLGETVGGLAMSVSNAVLFTTPLMLRLVHRITVRNAVRVTFVYCTVLFIVAWLAAPWPWVTVGALFAASVGLVMLDVCGGLPFLMAVKPSERTEMAAVYSSFRDVSGILTPLVAGAVLMVAPMAAVFGACGLGMAAAAGIAQRLHPRLGMSRRGTMRS
ncbi:MAG: MFS transporter [Rubellimicrobium sp.]|nr:MFS transporter [Rubellimicrobium sp.]